MVEEVGVKSQGQHHRRPPRDVSSDLSRKTENSNRRRRLLSASAAARDPADRPLLLNISPVEAVPPCILLLVAAAALAVCLADRARQMCACHSPVSHQVPRVFRIHRPLRELAGGLVSRGRLSVDNISDLSNTAARWTNPDLSHFREPQSTTLTICVT